MFPMSIFAFTKANALLNVGLFAATAAAVGGSWLAFLYFETFIALRNYRKTKNASRTQEQLL